MAKQVVLRWNSVADAVKELGEATVLSWLTQFHNNRDFRKVYNATRTEVSKLVRNDPRYKALQAEAEAKATLALPRLVKKG